MITLTDFLILGAILFGLSVAGIFLNRKNVIILLMAIELMLLAVNMNFVAFSYFLNDLAGQVFVFFILTVAAAEAAIGLAILVLVFRNRRTSDIGDQYFFRDLETLQLIRQDRAAIIRTTGERDQFADGSSSGNCRFNPAVPDVHQ